MRPLEVVVFVLLLSSLVVLALRRNRRFALIVPVVTAVASLLQVLIESYRWCMLPGYVLSVSFLLWGLAKSRAADFDDKPGRARRVLRIVGIVFASILLIVAILPPLAFPIFSFPRPTGTWRVGTRSYSFVDRTRKDLFGVDPNAAREIIVQVFYPAEPAQDAKPMAYMPKGPYSAGRLFAEYAELPSFILDHLTLVKTNTYENAPLVRQEKPSPVLVFNPGYVGYPAQNLAQFEDLASHGYVIFSMGHPGEAVLLTAPDGRAIPFSKPRTTKFLDDSVASADAWAEYAKLLADEKATADMREGAGRKFFDKQTTAAESLGIWTEDTRFFLDQLTQLAKNDPMFGGHIDAENIGIMGMSFGSGVTSAICSTHTRCKAAVVLDGTGGIADFDRSVQAPLLVMYSESAIGANDFVVDRARGPAYRAIVRGSMHFNFTDFNFFSPVFQQVQFLGPIDPMRMTSVLNAYLRAFLDQHLKAAPSSLLDGPSQQYPEVDLRVRKGLPQR